VAAVTAWRFIVALLAVPALVVLHWFSLPVGYALIFPFIAALQLEADYAAHYIRRAVARGSELPGI
jgi:hypothetical protein